MTNHFIRKSQLLPCHNLHNLTKKSRPGVDDLYWHSWTTLRFSFYSRHATVQMAKQPSKAMQFVPAVDGSCRV